MLRTGLVLSLVAALALSACAGQPLFEDRSDEVRITRRVPST